MQDAQLDPSVAAARRLIEAWCDRRELVPLKEILPGYLALNGLTDGWIHFYEVLSNLRAYYSSLPEAEVEMLRDIRVQTQQKLRKLGISVPY